MHVIAAEFEIAFSSVLISSDMDPQSGNLSIVLSKANAIILKIDNLLANWPTYVINYTLQEPRSQVSIV